MSSGSSAVPAAEVGAIISVRGDGFALGCARVKPTVNLSPEVSEPLEHCLTSAGQPITIHRRGHRSPSAPGYGEKAVLRKRLCGRSKIPSMQKCYLCVRAGHKKDGGGRGIRTPERVTPLTVFKTAGF